MDKRGKDVNWWKLANAWPKPKRLHLEEDDCDSLFHCPCKFVSTMDSLHKEAVENT